MLVAPPFYGPVDQVAVRRFYAALKDRTDLPILAYHVPAFTGTAVEPGTVAALARDGVIVGVKDSNRDLEYLQQAIAVGHELRTPWSTYVGTDSLLLPALILGATGGITLAANIVPSWTAHLVQLHETGDISAAAELQARLTSLLFALRRGAFPAGGKAALSILGLAGPNLVAPAQGLTPPKSNNLPRHWMPSA